ncbi:MAG: thioredoxin-dependent thiol peroxidase [Bacteroidales bacterium]|jgi:peroxiredoxin Q/BCP|nr:thioredoxin-dependent thiol peroxidase [Bacteroidales bacterium]
MTQLTAGMPAPQFEGTDQNGNTVKLSSFTGKKIVLYFYPKDDTPGCTAEACSLRDNYEELLKKGFVVLGVSPDNDKSHLKFAGKYNLPFPLIADPDKRIMTAYGAYGEKLMYGKKVTGVIRTTFIIDEKGVIEKVVKKVDTKDHANQIFRMYDNV